MKIAQRLSSFALLLFLTISVSPRMLAQGIGPYVAGVNYPAGPPTAPTNTGYWIGGISPVEIHYGDFNGDGKLDVIAASNCGYNPWFLACPASGSVIAVYLNNGDGTFSAPILSSGSLPGEVRSIAIGDFDGDGNLDVAAAADCLSSQDCSSGSITIFHGNGDGTFTQVSQYLLNGAVGQAGTVAVGDFNHDGKLDLVVGIECYNIAVTGCSFGSLSVYLGNGDGTFASATVYSTVGNGTVLPVVGDFNGDAKLDVIAVINGNASLAVLIGNGDGTFTRPPIDQVPLPAPLSNVEAVTAGDLNSDGKLDLVFIPYNSTVNVALGNGDGTFQSPALITTGISYQFSAQVIDLNHDGHPDIVVSGYGVQALLNDGNGNFVPGPIYSGLTGNAAAGLLLTADFNGDGNPDILTGAPGSAEGTLGLLLGNADGTMQGVSYLNQASIGGSSAIAIDVNGDGIPDIVEAGTVNTGSGDQGGILVFLGTGNGQYAAPVAYDTGVAPGRALVAGDFNGDGKIDIAVASLCSDSSCAQGGVSILVGNGDGTFQPFAIYPTGAQYAYSLAVGDFNGDGKLDVAVANEVSSVGILLGNGDGTLQPAVVTAAGITNLSIAAADFNGDGKTDIALGSFDGGSNLGSVQILLSGDNGALTLGASYPSGGTGSVAESVAVADVNKDGKLDIVVANQCQVADSGCSFGSLGTLIGNGDGTFVSGPLQTVPDGNLYSLLLADLNGDGILDAVAADPNGIEVFLGKGDGSFVTPVFYAGVPSPGQNTSVALADLNMIQPGGFATVQSAIFVNRAGTYLVSKSSANPVAGGQTVELTTSASASYLTGNTPTGSITYYDGTASLGAATLSGGTASLNISGLSAGVHTIIAYYSGDANFSAHYGTPLLQVVTASLQQAQTIAFTLSSSTVIDGSSPILLSATASSGLPVTFTVISGPGTVSGNTLTVTGAGNIVIEADQAGNSAYTAASPVQQTLTVTKAIPSVSFTGAPGTAGYLSTFVVSATTNATSVATVTATGACTLVGNIVTMISGTGVCNLSANWAADSNYMAGSATQNTTAIKIAPTIAFTGAPATAGYNSSFTVSATTNASTIAAIAASGTCTIVGATVTISAPSGTCSLNATWAADNNYLGASATQSTMATLATPTISWTTPAAITYGTALSGTQLDAKATYNGAMLAGTFVYTPAKGAVLTAGTQTLSVTFTPTKTADYTSASASVTLLVNQATPKITWTKPAAITYGTELSGTQLDASASVLGSLVYSPSTGTLLNAGTQTLSVTFTPTDSIDYATANKSVALTVAKAATATSITEVPSSSLLGQLVTFSATVTSPSEVTPTGTVTFKQGTSVLGSASLDTNGLATFATSALSVGNRIVTASYGASPDFGASSSTSVSETVSKLPSATSVSSSSNPAAFASSVMFTATIGLASGTSTSFPGTPTGTVSFFDGTKKLGSGTLSSSGLATFSISTLTRGSHTITAVYAGDGNFVTSTSGVLVQTVN